ncbi:MAG: hypothetical protein LBI86_01090, partial [Treponema sp.]|nr:hypothetical protein [Treponema sp.]
SCRVRLCLFQAGLERFWVRPQPFQERRLFQNAGFWSFPLPFFAKERMVRTRFQTKSSCKAPYAALFVWSQVIFLLRLFRLRGTFLFLPFFRP